MGSSACCSPSQQVSLIFIGRKVVTAQTEAVIINRPGRRGASNLNKNEIKVNF